MTKLTVLGCSGGIGGGHRTTAFLLDQDILIDAGTGVGDLPHEALRRIDHVFLTHSHLDHITSLPLLVDTVGSERATPMTVYAIAGVLDILKAHLFNDKLWPDFSVLPSTERPFLRFCEISVGAPVTLGTRTITALPAVHTVPAVGYRIDSGDGSLVFTGDTTENDLLWPHVNRIENLRYLIIETAFCNRDKHIAVAAQHLHPHGLARELAKMQSNARIFITHLKPGDIDLTMQEIMEDAAEFQPILLKNGDILEF
jgi:ribonuclease BN (tRNA processing enzyme)